MRQLEKMERLGSALSEPTHFLVLRQVPVSLVDYQFLREKTKLHRFNSVLCLAQKGMDIILELHPILKVFLPVIKGLAKTFGAKCEFVLHDLRHPRTSVIAAENTSVTGRKVGDGIRDLVWDVLRSPDFKEDMLLNYSSSSIDGKAVKSSTILIRNLEEEIIGALCINYDLSIIHDLKRSLDEFAHVSDISLPREKVVELQNANILDILEQLISKTIEEYPKTVAEMSKEDKINIVRFLDEKGVFRIKGANESVSERLSVSKSTLYTYLESSRFTAEHHNG